MVLSGVSAITAQKRHGKNYTCLYSLHRQQEQKERMSSLDCLCAPPLSFPILKTARSTHRQQQHDYNHHLFYPLDTIRRNSDHCHNRDVSAKEARMKTVANEIEFPCFPFWYKYNFAFHQLRILEDRVYSIGS